jgi:hypothetical protein
MEKPGRVAGPCEMKRPAWFSQTGLGGNVSVASGYRPSNSSKDTVLNNFPISQVSGIAR